MVKRFLELGIKNSDVTEHLDKAWDFAIWDDGEMKDPESQADYYFKQEVEHKQ